MVKTPDEGGVDTGGTGKRELRLCQDCAYYERRVESEPCRSCLPYATLVPHWAPRHTPQGGE